VLVSLLGPDQRGNAVRTRNAKLAMLRTFLKLEGHCDVGALGVIEQALEAPMKRFERPIFGFLSPEEMLAIIGKPGATWTSRRDHLMWQMRCNTGARVSETIGVSVSDVLLDGVACVHLHGKGRKQRTMPLWRSTAMVART
jgi:integrase